MATKSEQFHAEEQRRAQTAKAKTARSKPDTQSNESVRAGNKATYAFEAVAGTPTRKSTRKSANRSKPDTALTLHEQQVRGTPEARFRRESGRAS